MSSTSAFQYASLHLNVIPWGALSRRRFAYRDEFDQRFSVRFASEKRVSLTFRYRNA